MKKYSPYLLLLFTLLLTPYSMGKNKAAKKEKPLFIALEKKEGKYTLNEKRKYLLDENYLQLERDLNQKRNGNDRSFILHE